MDALEHFRCPDCGPHVKADEDGCCSTCGRDCAVEPCECREKAARLAALRSAYALLVLHNFNHKMDAALLELHAMIAKEVAK